MQSNPLSSSLLSFRPKEAAPRPAAAAVVLAPSLFGGKSAGAGMAQALSTVAPRIIAAIRPRPMRWGINE